jgi:hypothetical protein
VVWLVAQDAGSGFSSGLVQYGAIGILAALCLFAVRILFRREIEAHDRERARREVAEEELRKLNTEIRDKYIATLINATQVLAEVTQRMTTPSREQRVK